jgi:hypothetical protein
LQNLQGLLRLQTRRIIELEEHLFLLEGALQAVLHHLAYKSTTSHESAPPTLH